VTRRRTKARVAVIGKLSVVSGQLSRHVN